MKMNKAKQRRRTKLIIQSRMKRYHGENSAKLDLYNEGLKKSIEKVTTVSQTGIQARLDKLPNNESIETLLIANEDNFKPFIGQYCNKTGKLIYKISSDNFASMLRVHGKEETLNLLMELSTTNYCIEWLHTEPATLNKLMSHDPEGFFVYAANNLFSLSAPFTQSTIQFPGNLNLAKEKFERLQDKIEARKNLLALNNQNLIIEANELLRRLLGLAQPTKTMLVTFFTASNLVNASKDEQALKIFIADVKENLMFLLRRHFNSVRNKTLVQNQNLYRITSSDIAEIKAELKGLSQFHNQPAIKNQSKQISVMLDLRDFIFDELGGDDLDGFNSFGSFDEFEDELPEVTNRFKIDDNFMGLKINEDLLKEKSKLLMQPKKPVEPKLQLKPEIIPEEKKVSGFKLNIFKKD